MLFLYIFSRNHYLLGSEAGTKLMKRNTHEKKKADTEREEVE